MLEGYNRFFFADYLFLNCASFVFTRCKTHDNTASTLVFGQGVCPLRPLRRLCHMLHPHFQRENPVLGIPLFLHQLHAFIDTMDASSAVPLLLIMILGLVLELLDLTCTISSCGLLFAIINDTPTISAIYIRHGKEVGL
jgi:hypothetical protein